MRRAGPSGLRGQRGVALVGMALGMVAFSALIVASIDLARLSFSANEVQTLADVAATAGVRALVDGEPVVAAAQQAASQNMVDAAAGAIDPPGTVVVGTYDASTATFTAGGDAPNAVQANAEKTINNFLGAILGIATTRVEKTAIATFQTTGSGVPTLPLAIGDCHFQPDCMDQSCLPNLLTVPTPAQNSCWTGLTNNSDQTTIAGYFASPCGTGNAVPEIQIDDPINLNNGQLSPLYRMVRCLVCDPTIGHNEFLVPVIDCNQCNQSSPVTGFATVTVDHFVMPNGQHRLCQGYNGVNGGQAPESIVINTLFRTDVPGGPPGAGACTGCGTGYVTMVN